MIHFRVAEAPARGEYLVEAAVPACGNDAALIAVFNSQCAALQFATWLQSLVPEKRQLVMSETADHIPGQRELVHGDD